MSFADFLRFHWIQDPADGRPGGLAPAIPIPVPLVPVPVEANPFPGIPAVVPAEMPAMIPVRFGEPGDWAGERDPRHGFYFDTDDEEGNDQVQKKRKKLRAAANLITKQKIEEHAKADDGSFPVFSATSSAGNVGDDEASVWSDMDSESESQKQEHDLLIDLLEEKGIGALNPNLALKNKILEEYQKSPDEIKSDPVTDWVKKRNEATAARLLREDQKNGWNSSVRSSNNETNNVLPVNLNERKTSKDASKALVAAGDSARRINVTTEAERITLNSNANIAELIKNSMPSTQLRPVSPLFENISLPVNSSNDSGNNCESNSAVANGDNLTTLSHDISGNDDNGSQQGQHHIEDLLDPVNVTELLTEDLVVAPIAVPELIQPEVMNNMNIFDRLNFPIMPELVEDSDDSWSDDDEAQEVNI